MGSENKMNDGTSFEQSDKPILCANGCGFFGTPAMMNLCSKCYGDHRMKEEQAASAKIAVEKSMNSLSHLSSPSASAASTLVIQDEKKVTAAVVGASSSEKDVAVAPPKATNRCGSCNKKVGVMGFKCKCGCTFCGAHSGEILRKKENLALKIDLLLQETVESWMSFIPAAAVKASKDSLPCRNPVEHVNRCWFMRL
ncbi:hypothetical protein Nepgr_024591 [Nepenthes gracilis]|uniref:A20-type domain-containing protein n=1 Tax=Nepenthes gracilis TaxID=150966 RepID=A0AAD3T4G5_NEPGR|nr:hypothetical protein Nepgr_024591 [Nepenthes gracilis]